MVNTRPRISQQTELHQRDYFHCGGLDLDRGDPIEPGWASFVSDEN